MASSSNSAPPTGIGGIFGSRRPDPAEERAQTRREQERRELQLFLDAQANKPRTTRRGRDDDPDTHPFGTNMTSNGTIMPGHTGLRPHSSSGGAVQLPRISNHASVTTTSAPYAEDRSDSNNGRQIQQPPAGRRAQWAQQQDHDDEDGRRGSHPRRGGGGGGGGGGGYRYDGDDGGGSDDDYYESDRYRRRDPRGGGGGGGGGGGRRRYEPDRQWQPQHPSPYDYYGGGGGGGPPPPPTGTWPMWPPHMMGPPPGHPGYMYQGMYPGYAMPPQNMPPLGAAAYYRGGSPTIPPPHHVASAPATMGGVPSRFPPFATGSQQQQHAAEEHHHQQQQQQQQQQPPPAAFTSTYTPPWLADPKSSAAPQGARRQPPEAQRLSTTDRAAAVGKQRSYQQELEAQIAAKKMREDNEKRLNAREDAALAMAAQHGAGGAGGMPTGTAPVSFGRRRMINGRNPGLEGLEGAAGASGPPPMQQGSPDGGAFGGGDPRGGGDTSAIARAMAIANAALAQAGLPPMSVPPGGGGYGGVPPQHHHMSPSMGGLQFPPSLVAGAAGGGGYGTNSSLGFHGSGGGGGGGGMGAALSSPPQSHLRGVVDMSTAPDWQRAEIMKKHAEQAAAAAALREQIEAKERIKAEERERDRLEDVKEAARVEAEAKVVAERGRREREDEVRKKQEEEDRDREARRKKAEATKDPNVDVARAKAEEEAMRRKNKHARRPPSSERRPSPPPGPAVPFRSDSPPIPTMRNKGGAPNDSQGLDATQMPGTQQKTTAPSPPLPALRAAAAALADLQEGFAVSPPRSPAPHPPMATSGPVVMEQGVARAPSVGLRRRRSSAATTQQPLQPQQPRQQQQQQQQQGTGPTVFDRLQELRRDLQVEQRRVETEIGQGSRQGGSLGATSELHSDTRFMPVGGLAAAAAAAAAIPAAGQRSASPRHRSTFSPAFGTHPAPLRPPSRGSTLNLDVLERVNAARLHKLKELGTMPGVTAYSTTAAAANEPGPLALATVAVYGVSGAISLAATAFLSPRVFPTSGLFIATDSSMRYMVIRCRVLLAIATLQVIAMCNSGWYWINHLDHRWPSQAHFILYQWIWAFTFIVMADLTLVAATMGRYDYLA
ncbi:hypothetical protein BC828DRAFT_401954 [Blastocladiella britannica]|nr:hypothetical protein BC828DRAFT_401954 [Blastocladiella britannica]